MTSSPPSDHAAGSGYAPSPAEVELHRRLRSGDETAFTELVQAHHGAMVRLAMSFVRTRAAAEEVTQDSWLGVLSGLDRFEARCSLKSWILRIVGNKARTRAVRDVRSTPFSALGAPEEDASPELESRFDADGTWAVPPRPWAADTPERVLLHGEAIRVVQRTLEELPALQRAVVQLRDLDGLDALDVCNILEISETNQRVLLHRGRMRLRETLERYLNEEPSQ